MPKTAVDMMFNGYEFYHTKNWDGRDSAAITPDVLDKAKLIAKILLDPPSELNPAPGGDGSICFELEWKDGSEIWLDVEADGKIHIYPPKRGKGINENSA